jgi:hypothetical protein
LGLDAGGFALDLEVQDRDLCLVGLDRLLRRGQVGGRRVEAGRGAVEGRLRRIELVAGGVEGRPRRQEVVIGRERPRGRAAEDEQQDDGPDDGDPNVEAGSAP